MLCHVEEVEYLQQTGQPGCMVFMDFSKAYDRLSRSWVLDYHFLDFFLGRDGYSLHKCNDSNLKRM